MNSFLLVAFHLPAYRPNLTMIIFRVSDWVSTILFSRDLGVKPSSSGAIMRRTQRKIPDYPESIQVNTEKVSDNPVQIVDAMDFNGEGRIVDATSTVLLTKIVKKEGCKKEKGLTFTFVIGPLVDELINQAGTNVPVPVVAVTQSVEEQSILLSDQPADTEFGPTTSMDPLCVVKFLYSNAIPFVNKCEACAVFFRQLKPETKDLPAVVDMMSPTR